MEYSILEKTAKKADVSLPDFFADAHISFSVQKKMQQDDFVPSYIRLMFMSFIEKRMGERGSDYKKIKSDFFKRAKELGYKEKNGYIEIPLFSKGKNISISEVESQFVKFIM